MDDCIDFETWCWQGNRRSAANQELFAVARALGAKKQITRQELEQVLRNVMSSPARQRKEQQRAVQEAMNHFDALAGKTLRTVFDNSRNKNNPATHQTGDKGEESVSHAAGEPGRAGSEVDGAQLRQMAASMLSHLTQQLPAAARNKDLTKKIRTIKNVQQLLAYAKDIAAVLQENDRNDGRTAQPKPEQGRARLAGYQAGNAAVARDWFKRVAHEDYSQESFAGLKTEDTDNKIPGDDDATYPLPDDSLFAMAYALAKRRELRNEQVKKQAPPEISPADLQNLLAQLIEFHMLSPTFSDTFFINQERTAYLLAKEAFLQLSKQVVNKPQVLSGTHDCGRRGIAALQIDRVAKARTLTSRIAPVQTLRRGLTRRALYQSSPLLDEEDLMDYESRKKVGYAVVIAIDISGAVQFGRRIQGVRKACMAFGYYLKKQHPRDNVSYVAYHERPHTVSLAEVCRLKAINGAGKDIGGCLEFCLNLLKRDPERVPAIVLIGDGLPVRGDMAGFFYFKENNRAVIDKAYHAARLLRKHNVLFTFLQFQEDRHLWRDYADESAQRIASEAKGILYRIDDPITIAPSLIETYRNLRRR